MPKHRLLLLLAAFAIPACMAAVPPVVQILQVYAKGWTGARLLETRDGRGLSPEIAFSSNGTGFAAWMQQVQDVAGARLDIWATRYVPGAGWDAPQLIETEDLGHAFIPKLAVDPNGNATVVWSQSDVGLTTTHLNIWAARYVTGSGWQPAQLLETSALTAGSPVVACDPLGNVLVLWTHYDSSIPLSTLWYSRLTGTAWSAPQRVDFGPDRLEGFSVGMDAAGNGFAVVHTYDGLRMNVWANRFVPGSGWQGAVRVEQLDFDFNSPPQLSVSGNGSAMVVLSSINLRTPYVARYVPGAGWLSPEEVQPTQVSPVFDTGIGMDAAGNGIVIWTQRTYPNDSKFELWANRYVAGVGWQGASVIEPASLTGSPSEPVIAMSAGGDALVVWGEFDGFVVNAWATRYVVGIGWDAARQIESKDLGNVGDPRVAVDGQGRGAAVWLQLDGSHYDIWANRYE